MILSLLLWRGPQEQPISGIDIAGSSLLSSGVVIMLLIGFMRFGAAGAFLPDYTILQPLIMLGALIALAPVFLSALYCAGAAKWRHRKLLNTGLACSTGSTLAVVAQVILLVATFLAWLAFIFMGLISSGAPLRFLLAISLSFLLLIWWIVKWLWRMPPAARATTRYAVRWYQRTLGAFIVLSSVTYLAFAIITIPLWRAVDANVTTFIRDGEVTALRNLEQRQGPTE